jgi:hypothetical protein
MSYRLKEINEKMDGLKTFFINQDLQINENNVKAVLNKLLELKAILKNIDNNIHFLSYFAANSFLKEKHDVEIDLDKATGQGGLDIEVGDIVGEIKTTSPCGNGDFGANQKDHIKKDLERLDLSFAKHKYFFVIDEETEQILRRKYSKSYPSVKIVNLLKDT